MRVTEDEAMRLIDLFTDYVEGLVGEDIAFKRNPDTFSVELLRKRTRLTPPSLDLTQAYIGGPGSRRVYERPE